MEREEEMMEGDEIRKEEGKREGKERVSVDRSGKERRERSRELERERERELLTLTFVSTSLPTASEPLVLEVTSPSSLPDLPTRDPGVLSRSVPLLMHCRTDGSDWFLLPGDAKGSFSGPDEEAVRLAFGSLSLSEEEEEMGEPSIGGTEGVKPEEGGVFLR